MTGKSLTGTSFLSVSRSLTGRRWVDRLDAAAQREAMTISQVNGLRDSLARVLAGRGVVSADVEHFLEPTLRHLMPDPSVLRDMDKATDRLVAAIRRQEYVAIFGDYDVDGATSAALLSLYLTALGLKTRIHIPDRITEGYGPNSSAIRMLKEEGADLLVTVDCGISSHETLGEARRIGLDTIVLDHHLAGETLPDAIAIVNPNRQDDLSGLGKLAACGVVFMTLVALNRCLREQNLFAGHAPPDLMGMLDIVALGTVADVVPLTGLNRAFVRQGLKVMRQRGRAGLAALMDAAGLKEPPEAYHLGFLLGPRINAGGRIGDAALGARLLTTDDPVEAGRIAAELDRLNRERQALEQITLQQAEDMVRAFEAFHGERPVVVAGSAEWHPGVVGLVASRLKDRFRRPAIAIAWDEEKAEGPGIAGGGIAGGGIVGVGIVGVGIVGVGSCRSVAGVDIGRAIKAAADLGLIIKGGGHAMAAGLTLTQDGLAPLQDFLDERLGADIRAEKGRDDILIDAALTSGGLSMDMFNDLARAGPFGQGNAEPLFVLPVHLLTEVIPMGTAHLRVRFRGSDGVTAQGIAFRAQGQPLGDALLARKGRNVHLAGSLQVDRWGGRERVDLRLVDIADPL
ncbi:MAG: single-stranded-DNA-specific exonuclease RecJ [Beijerinckiaceae bacterium]